MAAVAEAEPAAGADKGGAGSSAGGERASSGDGAKAWKGKEGEVEVRLDTGDAEGRPAKGRE